MGKGSNTNNYMCGSNYMCYGQQELEETKDRTLQKTDRSLAVD